MLKKHVVQSFLWSINMRWVGMLGELHRFPCITRLITISACLEFPSQACDFQFSCLRVLRFFRCSFQSCTTHVCHIQLCCRSSEASSRWFIGAPRPRPPNISPQSPLEPIYVCERKEVYSNNVMIFSFLNRSVQAWDEDLRVGKVINI